MVNLQEWIKTLITIISAIIALLTFRDFLDTRRLKKQNLILDEHLKYLTILEKREELNKKGIEIPPIPPRTR